MAILLVFVILSVPLSAQWLNYPTPGTPRTRDGKPNLRAKAPRATNGKPDLSGVWQVEATPPDEMRRLFGSMDTFAVPGDDPRTFSKYFFNILADFKAEDAPLRAEWAPLFVERLRSSGRDIPVSRCLPLGIPMAQLRGSASKFIQAPGVIVMMQEVDGTVRQIHTDGRKHTPDPEPAWLGYSVGTWDADTLVVDTIGFKDKTWLDAAGHPHSEDLHVTERFHRREFGHLDMEITIDDAKVYTKPFTIKVTQRLLPDTDIAENFCAENEKDWEHMKNSGAPK